MADHSRRMVQMGIGSPETDPQHPDLPYASGVDERPHRQYTEEKHMKKLTKSRRRVVVVTGMAAVLAAVGAVSYQASAAEVAAPAARGADARAVSIPLIPTAIKPPSGSRPIGAYLVQTGTQNYTCGATSAYGTSTPEAQLIGTGGRIHHFGGPSWQSERDSSLVTAAKVLPESPRTGAIPELLLKVNSHAGQGIMDKADYINRLFTSGGLAPTGTCTPGTVAKIPYKAVYVFWDAPA
jgi:Protein of unknown function (DUF3455)